MCNIAIISTEAFLDYYEFKSKLHELITTKKPNITNYKFLVDGSINPKDNITSMIKQYCIENKIETNELLSDWHKTKNNQVTNKDLIINADWIIIFSDKSKVVNHDIKKVKKLKKKLTVIDINQKLK